MSVKYDYYTVTMDSEIREEAYQGDYDLIASAAIDECRERAKLYCIPCEWQIISDDGYTMIIRRKRNK